MTYPSSSQRAVHALRNCVSRHDGHLIKGDADKADRALLNGIRSATKWLTGTHPDQHKTSDWAPPALHVPVAPMTVTEEPEEPMHLVLTGQVNSEPIFIARTTDIAGWECISISAHGEQVVLSLPDARRVAHLMLVFAEEGNAKKAG